MIRQPKLSRRLCMKRPLVLLLPLLVLLLLTVSVFGTGKNEAAGKAKAEFTMKGEPVLEPKLPVGSDVEGAGKYTGEYSYEFFRAQALTGSFKEDYAKGKKLAITNLAASVPICTQIVNSVEKYWKLAGGKADNTLMLDNAFDVNTTIKNADAILSWGADAFVQYGVDEKSNTMISKKAKEKKLWVLGLDVTVEGFPFMGGDNWANGVLIGEFAIKKIKEQFGGIDKIDRVYYCWNPAFGEVVSYRMWGARKVMVDAFGYKVDFLATPSKAVQVQVGSDFQSPWMDILAKYPDDKKIVIFSPFEAASAGFYAAAKTLGRWNTENMLLCSLGGDDLGRPLIRSGITAGTVGWVPETYGTYVIPLVLAHMYGKPIPSVTYLQHVILTKENIEKYYPGEKTLYTEK
jgi:ABC-type sugar transport system substrate-binding protein